MNTGKYGAEIIPYFDSFHAVYLSKTTQKKLTYLRTQKGINTQP